MYIVIELQKSANGLAHLESVHNTRAEAESKFHQVLMAAAISNVLIHSAILMEENGAVLKAETYEHEVNEE